MQGSEACVVLADAIMLTCRHGMVAGLFVRRPAAAWPFSAIVTPIVDDDNYIACRC